MNAKKLDLSNMRVEQYMTPAPHTVGSEQSLTKAEKIMRDFKIRHLPVLQGGKLIGILSDRDVKAVESLKGVNPDVVTVSEALVEGVYSVSPKAPLHAVCAEMANHKYGSALVMDNHKLVGIFTWVDALKVFSQILES